MRRRFEMIAPRLVAVLLLGAVACGGDVVCPALPCALPMAVQLTVRDSQSASPITGASVTFTGPFSGSEQCSGATCVVSGGPGTYEIDVSAPGYQPLHQEVRVTGIPSTGCGCARVETQQLAVSMTRA